MGQKANWGPKSFLTSPTRIVPFEDFSTGVRLKADSENDTSGTEPINTRGRELQNVSFATTYHAAAGNDPLGEFNSWVSLVGASYPLYIGGRRLGPAARFTLQDVSMSDLVQAESGAVLSIAVSLSFVEYSKGKTSKLANTTEGTTEDAASSGTGGSGSTSSASAAERARATYNATVQAKTEAKNATADRADRAGKWVAMTR